MTPKISEVQVKRARETAAETVDIFVTFECSKKNYGHIRLRALRPDFAHF
jgi:hypothetical protein